VDDSCQYYPDMDTSEWLQVFDLFIAVRCLYVSKRLVPRIESALQEFVGGRTMDVLPALRDLCLEGLQLSGPVPKGIESFAAARELTDHPVEIFVWIRS
jgi:hypothetical protein